MLQRLDQNISLGLNLVGRDQDEADCNPHQDRLCSLLELFNFQRYDSFSGCVVAMQRGVRRAV